MNQALYAHMNNKRKMKKKIKKDFCYSQGKTLFFQKPQFLVLFGRESLTALKVISLKSTDC
jgi:hypothetical protein